MNKNLFGVILALIYTAIILTSILLISLVNNCNQHEPRRTHCEDTAGQKATC